MAISQCYAANVKAHLWIMQAAQEELKTNKGMHGVDANGVGTKTLLGSMIVIASTAGLRPGGSSMAYCACSTIRLEILKY